MTEAMKTAPPAETVLAEQVARVRELHAPRQLYEMDDHDQFVNDDQGCPVVWLTICTGCSSDDVVEVLEAGERVEEGEAYVRYENCPTLAVLDGTGDALGSDR